MSLKVESELVKDRADLIFQLRQLYDLHKERVSSRKLSDGDQGLRQRKLVLQVPRLVFIIENGCLAVSQILIKPPEE